MPEGVGEGGGADRAGGAARAAGGTDADTDPEQPQTPAFPAPSLAEVNFDDLLPPEYESEFDRESELDREPEPERQAPSFPAPPSMSDLSFDSPQAAPPPVRHPEPPQPVPASATLGFPPPPIVGPSGMGISLSGPGVPRAAPAPTPAQVAATSQALRIRLLRPDGKPFDGPEITTGPKEAEARAASERGGADAQRGPKKQAPKVVVKAGPAARLGHALAVLAISAVGIVPLAFLLLRSVHDREDELAARITVPTKMNVLNGTSDAYLAGMAAVLLVVAFVYWSRLKRRRMR